MTTELIILGNSSAIPAHNRGLSGQVLHHPEANYLIDCGEGTQFRLINNRVKLSKLNQIFISHLHGDHILGLPGLLATMAMQGRTRELEVFAPTGLSGMILEILNVTATHLNYPLNIHTIDPKSYKIIFRDKHFMVYSIPLDHRIPTCGFKFVEIVKRNIRSSVIDQYKLDFDQIRQLKSGKDIKVSSSILLKSADSTYLKHEPKSLAYMSDTVYKPSLVQYIRDVDLLYHEATYLHDLSHLAKGRKHSTSRQAAMLARSAGAEKLILGHFSSRYKNLEPLLEEAKAIFPSSYIGEEGKRFIL